MWNNKCLGLFCVFLLLMSFSGYGISFGQNIDFEKKGVTADGISVLCVTLNLAGISGPVKVQKPRIGALLDEKGSEIETIKSGEHETRIFYKPPDYISEKDLVPAKLPGIATPAWKAEVPLIFECGNGKKISRTLDVYRPPVILVHGFTGSLDSLASISSWLQLNKFDVVHEEYFNRDPNDRKGSSIEAQAEKLEKHVENTVLSYRQNDIKLTKLDLLAHSMGGLISRYYLKSIDADQPTVVRKLIMIATPNHGVPWTEKIIGNILAEFVSRYHQDAANQLFCGNPFYNFINKGEKFGKHLRHDVEYAVIAGVRQRYSHYDVMGNFLGDLAGAAEDDGVVARDSAFLNGVPVFFFQQMVHTYAKELEKLFPKDDPMPRSARVAQQVKNLLLRKIQRVPLKNTEMVFNKTEGDVYFKKTASDTWQKVSSVPLVIDGSFGMIKADKGSAVIALKTQTYHWGSIQMPPESEIHIHYAAPELLRAFVKSGQVRFITVKKTTGRFEIVLGEEGKNWFDFSPRAKISNLNTDFIVSSGKGEDKIFSLEGNLIVQRIDEKGNKKNLYIKSGKGVAVKGDGKQSLLESLPENVFNSRFFSEKNNTGVYFNSEEIVFSDSEVGSCKEYEWDGKNEGGAIKFSVCYHPPDLPDAETQIFCMFNHLAVQEKFMTVEKAVLELKPLSHASSFGEGFIRIYPVKEPWVPGKSLKRKPVSDGEICWVNQPSIDKSDLIARINLPANNNLEVFEIDITKFMNELLENKRTNYGFVIIPEISPGTSFSRFFASSDYYNVEKRPGLRIY
ncbi:MAG: alpha/beta fold hydrolase [Candidatus Riflebacteria bacterium]|nr:alpha/beta fold hydrolase [Candidatus Riflebacteria bacterium]